MEVSKIIAFFVERFSKADIGGVKSYLRRIITKLKATGTDVVIITQKTNTDTLSEEIIDDIKVLRFDCGDLVNRVEEFNKIPFEEKEEKAKDFFKKDDIEKTALALSRELLTFINNENPSVIHFHNSYFISPYALYFLIQSNSSATLPSFYFWSHSPLTQLILPDGKVGNLYSVLSSFQNCFKGIYAISKSVQESMIKSGINSKVQYLGIDTNNFQEKATYKKDVREMFNIPSSVFLLLYTGRIIHDKGMDLLPKICQLLLERDSNYKNIHFLIVGDGPYKNELQQSIVKNSLESQFHFMKANTDDELVDIYSQANCFILPSRREALGLSLLEAMSCSLSCIATDLPGIREVISHTLNGILVQVDNHNEFVRWISSIYSNKALLQMLKENARKTIEDQFSFDLHMNYFRKRLMK